MAETVSLLVSSRVLRRWRVLRSLASAKNWRTYLLEHVEQESHAFLIQKSFLSDGTNLKQWKQDFEKYCSQRRQGYLPLPAILDRFTEGENLYLIESCPGPDWKSLQESAPTDPVSWSRAFFDGLHTIGTHGNPNLDTVRWRDSQVLFCCTTFPQTDGEALVDDPAWLIQIVQSAFRQDMTAIFERSDLDDTLRDRLAQLLPPEDRPTGKPHISQQPGESLGHTLSEEQHAGSVITSKINDTGRIPNVETPNDLDSGPRPKERLRQPTESRIGPTLILFASLVVFALCAVGIWIWKHSRNTPATNDIPQDITSSPPVSNAPEHVDMQRVNIDSFTVEPHEAHPGDPITLSWKVTNAQVVRIIGIGTASKKQKELIGTKIVKLFKSSQIVLEAEGKGANNTASASRSIRIIVDQQPNASIPRIREVRITATTIGKCKVWLVEWTISGATNTSIKSDQGEVKDASAGYTELRRPGHYELRASNSDGIVTRGFTITAPPGVVPCTSR